MGRTDREHVTQTSSMELQVVTRAVDTKPGHGQRGVEMLPYTGPSGKGSEQEVFEQRPGRHEP